MSQLFADFEINRAPRWPLMTRLVMASIVAHGMFLVTVAYLPALQGLYHAAGTLAGFEFVSEDYDRSLIGQRATIINLAPDEKLYYPADYFLTNSPLAEPLPGDPALVAQVAPTPLPTPPPQPVFRPRRGRGPRVISTAPTPEATPTPEIAQATPTSSPTAMTDEEKKKAEEELDKIAAESGIPRPPRINTKPFEEIALKGKEMYDQGKINLSSALDVTATAELNEDGTLKPDTVKIEGISNDENMSLLSQQFVTAFSQSQVLNLLKGAKDVRMTLKLDREKVLVKITSELESAEVASKNATGYGSMVAVGRMLKKGTNEGELWNSLKLTAEDKQFVMTFEMPRDAAGKMIAEMLAKKAAAAASASKG